VYQRQGSNLSLLNSTFRGCSATIGGAIHVHTGAKLMAIQVLVLGSKVSIGVWLFAHLRHQAYPCSSIACQTNDARNAGPAPSWIMVDLGASFAVQADAGGGAISCALGASCSITSSRLDHNRANKSGGAILAKNPSAFVLSNVTMEGNTVGIVPMMELSACWLIARHYREWGQAG
jgi:hypothetical protein